jgi:hypothetical protein
MRSTEKIILEATSRLKSVEVGTRETGGKFRAIETREMPNPKQQRGLLVLTQADRHGQH